jgi:Bcr/CflA subfamily drug resistance transporter
MKDYSLFKLIFILTPFVLSFAFGLDIYIPIIPQMTAIFNTTSSWIQLTMSLFLLTTGIGQLFIGPLSDRYGRKNIFYISTFLFAFGSLCCAFSPNITWLILARILSSFGACGMLVTAFALVRDLFSGEESGQMYSFLNGAIGISPTFAPLLGGYLNLYLGWKSIFYFLTLLGIFSFFITNRLIIETHDKEKRVKVDRSIFFRYLNIFKNRQFLTYSLIAGCANAIFFCFFSTSPFIIIDLLGIPTHEFGYYFGLFGLVVSLGGIASGKIIKKFGIISTVKIGIVLIFTGGILMLAWHSLASLSLQGFLVPMMLACTGAMFLIGSTASAALEPFPSIAGTASAAFGALEFGVSAVIGTILMTFPVNSTVPYGITIILMAIFTLILFINREKEFSEATA